MAYITHPCGTTASLRELQCWRICETCSVDAGRSTSEEAPDHLFIQSVL